jgi:hypothetical protein
LLGGKHDERAHPRECHPLPEVYDVVIAKLTLRSVTLFDCGTHCTSKSQRCVEPERAGKQRQEESNRHVGCLQDNLMLRSPARQLAVHKARVSR